VTVTFTSAIFATTLLTATVAVVTPPDADVRACDQQARAAAGAPPVSPRAQPNAAAPGNDTQQHGRADSKPPQRPPAADGGDAYRTAFQACLHARGF
jgi:hypothetical protein